MVPVFVTNIIQRLIVRFQFIKGQPLRGAVAVKSRIICFLRFYASCFVSFDILTQGQI